MIGVDEINTYTAMNEIFGFKTKAAVSPFFRNPLPKARPMAPTNKLGFGLDLKSKEISSLCPTGLPKVGYQLVLILPISVGRECEK